MKDAEIKWYSMNLDQKIEEHEPIDLKRAIEITEQYLARSGEKFKDDKEAVAATMFGFSKSKSDFTEICVNGPKQISYKIEFSNPDASWFQKLGRGTFRHEEVLYSREKLIQKVTEFFSYSGEHIIQQYKGITNRKGRSLLGNKPDASLGIRIFTIIIFSFLGVFVACCALHGIDDGKIWWPSKYSHGFWIYRDRNPKAFWIWSIIYVAISSWMLRGCVLELQIVRKMLKERRGKNHGF